MYSALSLDGCALSQAEAEAAEAEAAEAEAAEIASELDASFSRPYRKQRSSSEGGFTPDKIDDTNLPVLRVENIDFKNFPPHDLDRLFRWSTVRRAKVSRVFLQCTSVVLNFHLSIETL